MTRELIGFCEQVSHMDHQIHFYDMRKHGFKCEPVLQFGYRGAPVGTRARDSSLSSAVPLQGSRYTRGSILHALFARGYPDGAVLVWDVRNGGRKVSMFVVCSRLVALRLRTQSRTRKPEPQSRASE